MGNTIAEAEKVFDAEDHPHIHGEYLRLAVRSITAAGSPPHTWGIRYLCSFDQDAGWITPTYMGNTCLSTRMGPSVTDHPHIHGEYFIDAKHSLNYWFEFDLLFLVNVN